jgi:hypothetical protein
MNPIALLAAAQRAQAVYIPDALAAQKAFSGLGMTYLGQYQDATHQGAVSTDSKGRYYVSISGTRYSEGYGADLFADIWLAPHDCLKGGQVASGIIEGMDKFWAWALSKIPATAEISVEGHSLGGERALLTPMFLPKERMGDIYAFEPPMFATPEWWAAYGPDLANAVCTVQGADRWFAWPPRQGYVHNPAGKYMWLMSTAAEWIKATDWKPSGFSDQDHSIDRLVERVQEAIHGNWFPQF